MKQNELPIFDWEAVKNPNPRYVCWIGDCKNKPLFFVDLGEKQVNFTLNPRLGLKGVTFEMEEDTFEVIHELSSVCKKHYDEWRERKKQKEILDEWF